MLALGLLAGLLVILRRVKQAGFEGGARYCFWRLADLCAPGLVLAQAIGSLGGIFNQEGYGLETTVPWAIYFGGALRHPLFLYQFSWNLVLFFFLLFAGKREKVAGAVFLRYFVWYFGGRYWVEGVLVDPVFWGRFKAGQVISLVLLHGGLILLWWRKRQFKEEVKRG